MAYFLNINEWGQYLIRFLFFCCFGIGFAIILGHFRPEWKSRKTVIVWMWTIMSIDIMLMNGHFAESQTALICIIIAGILNVINLVGDRVETIRYRDFSASLATEKEYEEKHTARKAVNNKIRENHDEG